MSRKKPFKRISWLAIVALSVALLISPVISGSAAPPPGDEEFGIIADAVNLYLNSRPVMYMESDELKGMLDDNNDGNIDALDNPANDPLVIDVRSNTDYQNLGHIPGAINIYYKDIVKTTSLATITTELAKHCKKQIVLACYTGHTDKLAAAALGAVAQTGYFGSPAPDVVALKWGNLCWNTPSETGHIPTYTQTYDMEATPNPTPTPTAYPIVDNTASTDPAEIVRVAGDLALQYSGFLVPGASPSPNPGNISNWTVLDVRSTTDYANHVPTAVNIPYQQLFNKVSGDYPNLLSIDRSRQIMVYANSQWEGNLVAQSLNMVNIQKGTTSSTATKGMRWGLPFWNMNYGTQFTSADWRTYPTVTGSDPGGLPYTGTCPAPALVGYGALSGLNSYVKYNLTNGTVIGWPGPNLPGVNLPHGTAVNRMNNLVLGNALDGKILTYNTRTCAYPTTPLKVFQVSSPNSAPNSICGEVMDQPGRAGTPWTMWASDMGLLGGLGGTRQVDLRTGANLGWFGAASQPHTCGVGFARLGGIWYVYLSNMMPNATLDKIDTTTGAVVATNTIPGAVFHQLAIKRWGAQPGVYVTNGVGTLDHFDFNCNLLAQIPAGPEPHSVAIRGTKAYVHIRPANYANPGTVAEIDLLTGLETNWGRGPGGRIVDPSVFGFNDNGDICGIALRTFP